MTTENQYKYKPCPFREKHYCTNCELLNNATEQCTFKLINWNLGILAKAPQVKDQVVTEAIIKGKH